MRSAPARVLVAFATLSSLAFGGGTPDLCATGPDEVILTHAFGDVTPTISYTVSNCGTGPGMNWTASAVGAIATFISVDNPGGTIDELGGSQVVNVVFDLSAAPIGVQQNGAIRFFQDGAAKVAKVIRFTLLKTPFELGDQLTGNLSVVDEKEVGAFEALSGQKVKLKFTPDDPALRARITIATANGVAIKSWKTKKKGKKTKKKVSVPSTGEFAVIIEVLSGTGTYTIETNRNKLPKTAKPRLLTKLKAGSGSDMVEVGIGAYAGAILNANVEATGATDINTLTVTLLDPSGATVNTSAFDFTSESAFHLVQAPLSDFGAYTLRVSGMTSSDAVDVPLTPYQPDQAAGTVDLDT